MCRVEGRGGQAVTEGPGMTLASTEGTGQLPGSLGRGVPCICQWPHHFHSHVSQKTLDTSSRSLSPHLNLPTYCQDFSVLPSHSSLLTGLLSSSVGRARSTPGLPPSLQAHTLVQGLSLTWACLAQALRWPVSAPVWTSSEVPQLGSHSLTCWNSPPQT